MTPAAQPTTARALPANVAVPARLIQPGEEIVLAIKPSGFYILLVSLPVIFAAALGLAVAYLLDIAIPSIPLRTLGWLAALACAVRLLIGLLEWLARVYVLTNLRLLRVKGVLNVDVFECSLTRIQNTVLSLPLAERLTGVGTILFATAGTAWYEAAWLMISRPAQVHEIVVEYIRRAHHPPTAPPAAPPATP